MNSEDILPEELQKAVALFYDGSTPPEITAKGSGKTAEEILALANQHDVPICNNEPLLELLMTLELGDSIPPALYVAVAHIIAFAYGLQGKTPDEKCDLS